MGISLLVIVCMKCNILSWDCRLDEMAHMDDEVILFSEVIEINIQDGEKLDEFIMKEKAHCG